MQLTIAIPTYNRKDKLKKIVERLLEEEDFYKIKLLIVDNASDYSLNEVIEELNISDMINIEVIRNKYNVGMSANFMKCFEYCKTEWMWLLGDDDEVLKGSITQVLNDININRKASLIKYSLSKIDEKDRDIRCSSLKEVIEYLSLDKRKFNSFIFISNSIFNVKDFKEVISKGYQYAYTFAPHVIMSFFMIYSKQDKDILFKKDKIVNYIQPDVNERYSIYISALGIGAIKNFDFELSKMHSLKLEKLFLNSALAYKSNFIYLYLYGVNKGNFLNSRKFYKNLKYCIYEYLPLKDKILCSILSFIMRDNYFIKKLILLVAKNKNYNFKLKDRT